MSKLTPLSAALVDVALGVVGGVIGFFAARALTNKAAAEPVRQVIEAKGAPKAIGPYSHGVRVGSTLFVSGCIGVVPETGDLAGGSTAEQARQSLRNLSAILAAGGSSTKNVLKTTVLLVDMADYASVNEVYKEFFPEAPPARAAYAVNGLPKSARVEIECVAHVPN